MLCFAQMEVDPTLLSVAAAVLVVLLTIVIIARRLFGKPKNTVLIVGLSDSGKTHVFSKLINKNADVTTYTSLSENVAEGVKMGGSELRVVDFPGAERLRKQLIAKWLGDERNSLRSIVFVVDSSSFGKRARDVAEFLYDVALETAGRVPIIAACSKQDLSLAKSPQVIESSLEKELGLINQSRSAALTSTDGSASRNTLSESGKDFQWSELSAPVRFVECNAVDKDGLESLRSALSH